MYQTILAVDAALGHILRHNLSSADGRKALPKGRRLRAEDVQVLRELGLDHVRVAVLEAGDVHEDEAASRLAAAVCGGEVLASDASHSRVNLLAQADGIVQVDVEALLAINAIEGLTIATLAHNSLVRMHKRVATIKIIPFAVREADLVQAEAIARAAAHGIVAIHPLRSLRVGVLLVGSAAARTRIEHGVLPAIESRVVELGSVLLAVRFATADEHDIAEALGDLAASGAELIIAAGETSIMDRDDVTPQGVQLAGGRIEHYGAPVEPGNLLLLGYLGELPVLGAPGCVRSRATNIVDLLLPRLLAGEHLTSRDIILLGHGGLL
ncbi:MAG: molybdopterin-binding protein [Roseiflexaceae bacterium]|nr:molybdopterin-binding protein [Roseiflexaceae bacterium]